MEVESEQELSVELREFIDRLIVPLLVERCKAKVIAEVEDVAQTGSGIILTHGPVN
jgi:hypothetical protein